MGLRDKIKGAMHPDREREEEHTKYGNTTTATAPGAFPEDKYDSNYDSSKYGDTKYGDTKYSDTKYSDTKYDTARADRTGTDTYGHRKADSGVDFGADRPYGKEDTVTANAGRTSTNSSQGEYWGNMGNSNKRSSMDRKELPLRPNEQNQTVGTSNLDSQRFDPNRSAAAAASNSPTGGTYNTVSGAGSRDYQQDRIRGAGYSHEDEYDSRLRDRDMGRDARDSRDNRAALGAGAAGAAGVAGAGLAAHQGRRSQDRDYDYLGRDEFDSRDDGFHRGTQYQAGGGVPQSSMIDGQRINNSRAGPHDSDFANKMDPRVDSDLDSRRAGAGAGMVGHNGQNRGYNNGNSGNMGMGMAGAGAGMAASNMTSSTSSSGMGPDHFGPGHPGAKVVHRCVGCGMDNDISQYFRKDITYRMG